METISLKQLFDEIKMIKKNINSQTNLITSSSFVFFENQEEKQIVKESNELTFIYTVSYLYILFYERSKLNTNYIVDKMPGYSISNIEEKTFLILIHDLRTYLFHYLSDDKIHDKKIRDRCKLWFLEKCNNMEPSSEIEWKKCVENLLVNTQKILQNIDKCLTSIGNDEEDDKKYISNEWITKNNKEIPDYVLIELTENVLRQYNLDFDSNNFIKHNNSKIRNKIKHKHIRDFDHIKEYISLWIEHMIFDDDSFLPCPVSGNDIKTIFRVTGKKIGEIKEVAMDLFKEDRYLKKDQIIDELKKQFSY